MSENINLMKVMQAKFQKLSKGQKIIAQYIMKNYDKAIMWLKAGTMPSFLKEDIKEYMRMYKRLQIKDQEIKKIEKMN